MKTVVGLDMGPTDGGALAFARRLAEGSELSAVHVIEKFAVSQAAHHAPLAQIEQDAQRTVAARLAPLSGVHASVAMGQTAEQELTARGERAEVLVLGRRATARGMALVHLGRVARRVLRALPTATIVVPPDWTAEGAGDGPVILATDLAAESEGAALFAKRLAGRLGADLVVVHAIEDPQAFAGALIDIALDPFVAGVEKAARERAGAWADAHGLGAARLELLRGDPVGATVSHAQAVGAQAIVCGSRRASLANRVWRASVGSALAGHAPCPTAVVPADYGGV